MTNNYEQEYEELSDFLGCYFNQDWKMEAENVEGLVKNYLSDFDDPAVDQCIEEIEEILDLIGSGELDADTFLLKDMFVGYYYPEDGFTGEQWLRYLKSLILELRKTVKFQPIA